MPSYFILCQLLNPFCPHLDLILAKFETIPRASGIAVLFMQYLAPFFLVSFLSDSWHYLLISTNKQE